MVPVPETTIWKRTKIYVKLLKIGKLFSPGSIPNDVYVNCLQKNKENGGNIIAACHKTLLQNSTIVLAKLN